ncbi:MAG TPA: glycine betaine ABC transporter substrate-binding protein [Jatrophihabitantaceae bacterium]|jgi:osmoprotectant transport system substrate-binding protein|nr:glycine betaine ABC transporter substrate-binding protein [Jatrophihabitantaceae bacterium]
MKRKTLTIVAGAAAVTMALAACGSSTKSSGGSTTSSSGSIASKLILGGPPEFKTRAYGIAGLDRIYGVTFGTFKALDEGGPLTITALKNGQIDAGDIFTTDPSIPADNFVVLDDPKNLFAAQDVLPLINSVKATTGVKEVLNAISAKITTADLIALNVKVEADKDDPDTVAKQWLSTAGLDTAGTEAAGSSLTVGSANFPENVVLADIYAEALKAQGAKISTKLNIGSRETYIPGLKDGSIDLIPEYSGNLLEYLDPTATAVSSGDVYAALQKALPAKLIVLNQSDAQDKDAIVVTKATAAKYHLTSIADLANPS